MATVFPANLDNFTNPAPTDTLGTAVGGRTHSQQHDDLNDAVEALEARVGVTGSVVGTSLTNRIAVLEAAGSAGPKTLLIPNAAQAMSNPAVAYAGRLFTPSANMSLTKLITFANLSQLANYGAAVITISGGNVATISNSNVVATPNMGGSFVGTWTLDFASPVALTSGTQYGLIIGNRSGGTPSPALQPYQTNYANETGTWGANITLIASNPIVGSPVVTAAVAGTAYWVGMVWN